MLKEDILNTGISNCLFVLPFKKVLHFLGGHVSVANYPYSEDYLVPAVIDESQYKISDNHKISLKPLHPDFSTRSFYLSDLELLIKNKTVKAIYVY